MKSNRIAIIGAGSVGSTTAYALMMTGIVSEIILIDIDNVRCQGEVLDLTDAAALTKTTCVRSGTFEEAKNANIIIVAAGTAQTPGQTRTDLLERNGKIIQSVMREITPTDSEAIIIMVTNPVDILTQYAQLLSNLPRNQIIGSGTLLDSQRLRVLLSQELNISEKSINAYVLGEHGDTQFPVWSKAQSACIPLINQLKLAQKNITQKTRDRVYEIIKCKGATCYGIAQCLAYICTTILLNQNKIMPLSCYQPNHDICISILVVLGSTGIKQQLPLVLDANEKKLLDDSVNKLQKIWRDFIAQA